MKKMYLMQHCCRVPGGVQKKLGMGLIWLYGKQWSKLIFTEGFSIYYCSDPVKLEAVGTSADELNAGDNCMELFLTIIASYDYVHF